MKTTVELSKQVLNFVRSLAPEPRRALRAGLRGLAEGRGDIKQLEGELADWCRLRVKSYRVIFRYEMKGTQRVARCVFAERRELVYELFAETIRHLLEEE
jgi:mRNA-degrading endonuclease RelE of RelBE toxin-antitoxin system